MSAMTIPSGLAGSADPLELVESVLRSLAEAEKIVADARARGRRPALVGGDLRGDPLPHRSG